MRSAAHDDGSPDEGPDFWAALALESGTESARARWSLEEANRGRGVCWSGLGPDPYAPCSPEELQDRARRRIEIARAWRATAHGGFLQAVAEAQRAAETAHAAAESARAASSRDFAAEASRCALRAREMEQCGRRLVAAARRARLAALKVVIP